MKVYQAWEVVKMLTDNPNLIFQSSESSTVLRQANDQNMLVNQHGNIALLNLKSTWNLVNEPVSFIEAIKAYNSAKTIKCTWVEDEKEYNTFYNPHGNKTDWGYAVRSEQGYSIDTGLILHGKWFIEENI